MNSFVRLYVVALVCLAALEAQTPRNIGWSRYLPGGSYDVASKVVVEPSGDVWVAGHSSGIFEAYGPNEPYQTNNAGKTDIFLVKYRINPDGSSLILFFTWLGGAETEELSDMKLDAQGRVVITGITNSTNFPIAGSPLQNIAGGDFDAFVSIIDPNQGGALSLSYSTYFGGVGRELAKALAIGPSGNIAVVGTTTSDDVPGVLGGAQPNRRGNSDAFIFYFNPSESALSYASYLGGNGNDTAVGVVIDKSNLIWFVGSTGSDDFPLTINGVQTSSTGFFDAYVAAVDPAGRGLSSFYYGSLLGGSRSDEGRALAIDENGKLWVSGITFSEDVPMTDNAAQRSLAGGTDAFVMQIDPLKFGTEALLYSSYVGGTGFEFIYGMSLIDNNRVALAGYSMAGQLPTTNDAVRKSPYSGFADGMIAVVNSGVSGKDGLEYMSYFGGGATDVIQSVSFDPTNPKSLYLAGYTTSSDLQTTEGLARENPPPSPAAFAAKILR